MGRQELMPEISQLPGFVVVVVAIRAVFSHPREVALACEGAPRILSFSVPPIGLKERVAAVGFTDAFLCDHRPL